MNNNPIEMSEIMKFKLKTSGVAMHKLARRAGVKPQTFYALHSGIATCRHNDERVIAVGALLGLTPAECFAQYEKVGKK